MSKPHLHLAVKHQIGNLQIACDFKLDQPWTVLFGPSGSGKSTLLRILAGIIHPQQGKVIVHEVTVQDTAKSIHLPAPKRPVIWAGQRPALFPHKTVRQNLAFSHQASLRVDRAIDHFSLAPLAARYPHQLSGGEQQRTAVVRAALAAQGKTLLLDEPFSGLDFRVRNTLIDALRAWHAPAPIVSVTHSVEEAFVLQAWVVKLHLGEIVAQGFPDQALCAERAALLANLA